MRLVNLLLVFQYKSLKYIFTNNLSKFSSFLFLIKTAGKASPDKIKKQ